MVKIILNFFELKVYQFDSIQDMLKCQEKEDDDK